VGLPTRTLRSASPPVLAVAEIAGLSLGPRAFTAAPLVRRMPLEIVSRVNRSEMSKPV
jgi:hypothetical protein